MRGWRQPRNSGAQFCTAESEGKGKEEKGRAYLVLWWVFLSSWSSPAEAPRKKTTWAAGHRAAGHRAAAVALAVCGRCRAREGEVNGIRKRN